MGRRGFCTGGPSSEVGPGAGRDWLLHPHARNMATHKAPPFLKDRLTSSKRDPTLAVTSSIPVPCAAVSFPAMALPRRRWVWDVHGGDRRWKNVGMGREAGVSTNTSRQVCVLKTAYKAGNVSEEAELRRLGWSIIFFVHVPVSRAALGAPSVGGSLLLVSPLHSHH